MLDERSIDQRNYTAFQTQSVAYIEQEKGKFDAFKDEISSIPPMEEAYPYEMVMRVGTDKTTIERWSILDKAEEKADARWTLTYPLQKSNFVYGYDTRAQQTTPPAFTDTTLRYVPAVQSAADEKVTLPGISFKAAADDDLVQSYETHLKKSTGEQYTYKVFSDYYLGSRHRTETVQIALDQHLEAGEYQVTVYAIDSFEHYSTNAATGTIYLKR